MSSAPAEAGRNERVAGASGGGVGGPSASRQAVVEVGPRAKIVAVNIASDEAIIADLCGGLRALKYQVNLVTGEVIALVLESDLIGLLDRVPVRRDA
ncbi:hypothetical protein [Streptomyces xanthochromogenes]|uniref:hypothetical protein n=1 Tax=Streptomyces xanthochromogenes TaxID=67384 RepID=UPI00167A5508|nr:hypothetical protein [Streptomyces xanthochromogenes]